jgi:hypothetical protein
MTFLVCLFGSKEFGIERLFFSGRETCVCSEKLSLIDHVNKIILTD